MMRIKSFLVVLIMMIVTSAICLGGVSILAYTYKWQADKALIGITITYIVTGFIGGVSQKILNKEQKNMGKKMVDGIVLSSVFMGVLVLLSICVTENPMNISSRFLMIWVLLMGSSCLGRIL